MKNKIVDYSVKLNSKGGLYIQVLFQSENADGSKTNLRWFGSFNEGTARNITNATLAKMGLRTPENSEINTNESPSQAIMRLLNKGVSGGMLNDTIEYELETEVGIDPNGNPQTRIKSIRLPGERAVQSMSDEDLAKAMMQSSIGDELLAKAKKYPRANGKSDDEDSVPF